MNIPFIAEPAYYKQIDAILAALEAKADEETKKAENRIGEHVFKETNQVGSDEIVDAAIAFDSTWAKKSTSLIWAVFVISVDTGEVLDCHILSKKCRKCAQKKSKLIWFVLLQNSHSLYVS